MALLDLGRVVATPGALEILEEASTDPLELLGRHAAGDWGVVPPEDRRENVKSVKNGWRVLSSYPIGSEADGRKVWILTEADRSATTILIPSEY